jgi:hypothetical protein
VTQNDPFIFHFVHSAPGPPIARTEETQQARLAPDAPGLGPSLRSLAAAGEGIPSSLRPSRESSTNRGQGQHNMNYEQRMNHRLNQHFGSIAQLRESQPLGLGQRQADGTASPSRWGGPAGQHGVSRQPSAESMAGQARAASPSVFGGFGRPPVPNNPFAAVAQRPHSTPPGPNVGGEVRRTPQLTNSNRTEAGPSEFPDRESRPITTTRGPTSNALPQSAPINIPSGGTNGVPRSPIQTQALLVYNVDEVAAERELYGPRALQSFMVIESFLRQDHMELDAELDYLVDLLLGESGLPLPDPEVLASRISYYSSLVTEHADTARHVIEVIHVMNLARLGSARTLSDVQLDQYTPLVHTRVARINMLIDKVNQAIDNHPQLRGQTSEPEPPRALVAVDPGGRARHVAIPPMDTVAMARNLLNLPVQDRVEPGPNPLDMNTGGEVLRERQIHRGTLDHLMQQEIRPRPRPTRRQVRAFDPQADVPSAVRRRRNSAPAAVLRAAREPAEMRDLLAPIIRNLWLALRIGGLLYFFNLGGGMHWNWRPLVVLALAAAWYVVQAGLFNEQLDLLRGYLHRVVGVAPPVPTLVRVDGRPDGGNNFVVAMRPGRPQEEERMTWLERRTREVERAVALFVASLWPGVGEAAVRMRVEQERRERELVEEERRIAEERRELEEQDAAEAAEREAAALEDAAVELD